MSAPRRIAAVALILGLGVSQSGCIALAVGTVAGAAIGITAKGVGKAAGAILPGGGHKDERADSRRQ